jgi:hypothetical protein
MNLRDEVEKIKTEGYSEANAESKLCQDIVLKAIAESGMARNAMDDVVKRVERVFSNKAYVDSVSKSGKNWLDMPVEAVLKKDLEFIKSL